MTSQICDKCNGKIIDGKCPCGVWADIKDQPNFLRLAETILFGYEHLYNNKEAETILGFDHYTGNCMVIFRGDYHLCQKVKAFIHDLQEKNADA